MLEAYLPQVLPIKLDDKEHIQLLRQTISVTRALEALHQKFENSLARGNLFSMFSFFESVKSTRIEGTKTTFDEVMEAEVTKKKSLDLIETTNYNKAIQYGRKRVMEEDAITLDLICELHKLVLKSSRGANKNPGNFRENQNWIGDTKNYKSISYVPPAPEEVPLLMKNLEVFINENKDFEPLIAAGIIHAQFETIHPFSDGNGRVGRLLIPLYLLKNKVCGNDIVFISDELEKNKYKYYSLLNAVRLDKPQWSDWLTFFLTSIEKQAEKYLEKLDQIDEVVEKYINDDKIGKSTVAQQVLFSCVRDPITTSSKIAEINGIALNSANKWLRYFVDKKMLYTDSKQRNKIYRFYEVLDAIR